MYKGRITKRMTVNIAVGMPAVTGQIVPFRETDGMRVVHEVVDTQEFDAALPLQKTVALTTETRVLLVRTDLPPTQMRIIGSGEVVELPEKVVLFRPRTRVGRVQRLRERDVLVEGLASSKEVAERLVGSKATSGSGVVGIIRQPFGTRGVVAIEFEDPVRASETVTYQRLTEEVYTFGR